jgi:hypothetical protein
VRERSIAGQNIAYETIRAGPVATSVVELKHDPYPFHPLADPDAKPDFAREVDGFACWATHWHAVDGPVERWSPILGRGPTRQTTFARLNKRSQERVAVQGLGNCRFKGSVINPTKQVKLDYER